MSSKLFSFFHRPLRSSGRKAPAMSQATVPAVPLANEPLAQLIEAIGQLSQQQRMLFDALKPAPLPSPAAVLQPSAPAALTPPFASPTVPTPSPQQGDLRSLVAELFKEHQASVNRSGVKEAYSRDHLADLPDAYRRLLPDSADPATLAAAEQSIRQQFRDDLKASQRASGEPGAMLGGGQPGGQPPAAAVDYTRLSPMQQIALGLKNAATPATSSRIPNAARPPAPQEEAYDLEPLFVGAD